MNERRLYSVLVAAEDAGTTGTGSCVKVRLVSFAVMPATWPQDSRSQT